MNFWPKWSPATKGPAVLPRSGLIRKSETSGPALNNTFFSTKLSSLGTLGPEKDTGRKNVF